MTAITFDTLAFVKKLKKAGVPEKQAEAQVEITAEIMKEMFDNNVATKDDLKTLRSDLTTLKADLTLRMGGIVAAGVGIATTLIPIVLKLTNLA